MDKYIDARFERVERALAALVDSIAKYNPSASHANELRAATVQLQEGLEQVKIHQINHLRIQSMKAESAALDDQIKSILVTLASTRKDLTSTPTTVFPKGPSNEIRYSELLSYARRISKTTLPPPGTASPFDPRDGTASPADVAPTPAATTPGGGATPLPATNGAPTPVPPTPSAAGGPAIPASQATTTASSSAQLPEYMGSYLNPQTAFLPWPSVDQIRRGGLAANQVLLHRGVDLRAYDPEAEEAQTRAAAEAEREREQAAEEERARREAAARARQVEINASMGGAAAADGPMSAIPRSSVSGPGEKGQFQFMQDDDDDDDDD